MWEYKRVKQTGKTPEEIIQILNELGQERWEVIQYEEEGITFTRNRDSSFLAILKRQTLEKKVL